MAKLRRPTIPDSPEGPRFTAEELLDILARPGLDRPDDDVRWREQRTELLRALDGAGFDPRQVLRMTGADREVWMLRRSLAARELV
jgi:hypothetical protein